MSTLTSKQLEVAQMIVEACSLEEVEATDIEPNAALFRDGLGLDSIDALELSLAIKQRYGIHLRAEDTNIAEVYASLSALTAHIEANS